MVIGELVRQVCQGRVIGILAQGEEGQDLVEYGILVTFLSVAAIAVLLLVGPALSGLYEGIASTLSSV